MSARLTTRIMSAALVGMMWLGSYGGCDPTFLYPGNLYGYGYDLYDSLTGYGDWYYTEPCCYDGGYYEEYYDDDWYYGGDYYYYY